MGRKCKLPDGMVCYKFRNKIGILTLGLISVDFEEVPGKESHVQCLVCSKKYAGAQIIAHQGMDQHIHTSKHQVALDEAEDFIIQPPPEYEDEDLIEATHLNFPVFQQDIDPPCHPLLDQHGRSWNDLRRDEAGQLLDENWDPILFSAGVETDDTENHTHMSLSQYFDLVRTGDRHFP